MNQNDKTRRASVPIGIVAAFLALSLGPAESAHAAAGKCAVSKIAGRYGFLASGHALDETSNPVPYASGGVLTLSKNKTFSIQGTQTLNGVVGAASPNVGTYTLEADCTGKASVNGQPFFDFTVTGENGDLQFIRSDVGVIITGQAKRAAEKCTLAKVKGSYGYAFNAIVFNIPINGTTLPEAFFAGGGVVSVSSDAQGLGRAALDDTASFGGIVVPRHYEGNVTVNADCTGAAEVTLPPNAPTSGNPVHVNVIWVDDRKSVLLIQTDPGTFIAGEAKKLSGGAK